MMRPHRDVTVIGWEKNAGNSSIFHGEKPWNDY